MLKLLLTVFKLSVGALILLFLSLVLNLLGYVYDYPQFLQTSAHIEMAASLLLVCSVTIGGALGLLGGSGNLAWDCAVCESSEGEGKARRAGFGQ